MITYKDFMYQKAVRVNSKSNCSCRKKPVTNNSNIATFLFKKYDVDRIIEFLSNPKGRTGIEILKFFAVDSNRTLAIISALENAGILLYQDDYTRRYHFFALRKN